LFEMQKIYIYRFLLDACSATASAFVSKLFRALRNRRADFVQFRFCLDAFLKRFLLTLRFFKAPERECTSRSGRLLGVRFDAREPRLFAGDGGSGGGAALNELRRFILFHAPKINQRIGTLTVHAIHSVLTILFRVAAYLLHLV
jgi:hypothetical protein